MKLYDTHNPSQKSHIEVLIRHGEEYATLLRREEFTLVGEEEGTEMYTLWFKRRTNLLKVLLVAVTAMLAAWLLALVGTAKPAGATFPGQNGKIAYQGYDGTDLEIYTINADGTEKTQLTNDTMDQWDNRNPAWSPDGTRIAYFDAAHLSSEIYTIPATGGTPSFLTRGVAPDWQPLPAPVRPDSKTECKEGGYEEFGFKNYGQCIASVQRATKSE